MAVPNLSTGPVGGVLGRLEVAFSSSATVLDRHSDAVHGRTVFTLAGPAAGLVAALVAGAEAAIELIDLNEHSGAHPRIGAIDVAPIVYPEADHAVAAEASARDLGSRLGTLGLPVFLYGALARSPERSERHYFRRGGVELLAERMEAGELDPDFGPSSPHPTAGAVLVTARPPLAAFNVELEGVTTEDGGEIAAALREAGGGIPGVRAIAIELDGGRVQISTNVHDPVAVPLAEVVSQIQDLALPLGGRAVAAELIGLVPEVALAGYPAEVPIGGLDPAQRTIEARLEALDPRRGLGGDG